MTTRANEWHSVLKLMPEAVREIIPTVRWRRDLLWTLELPIEMVAVADFAWLFDLPLWAIDGRPFQVSPNDIRTDPSRYAEQYRRTMAVDLHYPIHLTRHNDRWTVLDGFHRLLKADLLGWTHIPAMKLSPEDFRTIIDLEDQA